MERLKNGANRNRRMTWEYGCWRFHRYHLSRQCLVLDSSVPPHAPEDCPLMILRMLLSVCLLSPSAPMCPLARLTFKHLLTR